MVKLTGCKRQADYHVYIASNTKIFVPKTHYLAICRTCLTEIENCKMASVTITENLIELRKELILPTYKRGVA